MSLFHRTGVLRSFLTQQRWSERYQLVIAKKEVEFDYVGIDVSGLVGMGLRLAKNVNTEHRRNKEVARHVTQQVHQILKRFHAKKGVGLFLDGSESLAKAHHSRSSTMTRKLESRLTRLPASPLMQSVEERVVRMMPENRTFPAEVVFCGTTVPGPVEQKFSAWALDVAAQHVSSEASEGSSSNITPCNDSLCLIGGSDLHLNALGLTPFFNISNIVQHNSDFKQIRLQDSLEWLTLDSIAKRGETVTLGNMRTDVLFLVLLTSGLSATELAAIPQGTTLHDTVKAYLAYIEGQKYKGDSFLLQEVPSASKVLLNTNALFQVLVAASRVKAVGTVTAKYCAQSELFIKQVMLSHRLLSYGHHADPYSLPGSAPLFPALLGHLNYLSSSGKDWIDPCEQAASFRDPLTAAEFTILSHSQSISVESLISNIVGHPPKAEAARLITSDTDPVSALSKVRELLSYANPQKGHKCLHYSPSYCWLQNPKSKLWTFHYVDVGARAMAVDGRRLVTMASSGSAMTFAVATDGPCVFDKQRNSWEAIESFPFAPDREPGDERPVKQNLKLLSWNVMFDRYSGKPTPLGMPGIDWCSPRRYPVLSKVLEQSDADVIGMQEVEPAFWAYLAEQPWVRDRYIMSCNKSGPAINPWGVLMMVHRRMSVDQLQHHNVPAWSGHVSLLPVLTLSVNGRPLHVAAIHLLAPFTKGRESARTGQDNALRLRMTKSITGDCVTMGDFNDWPTNEFIMPPDSDYKEAWPIVHPNNPGKTMDETNLFCRLKIEEIFFGRSDKFFFRGTRLKPIAAQLVGVKSVNDENGNSDAPAYLFPSDHYGVEMTFSVG